MRRTKEDVAITREQLMEQALTAFSRRGYAATTLADIAAEVNVTRGAIYWHFGSKAELYRTLLETYSGRQTAALRQAVSDGGSLIDILRRAFVVQLQAVEENASLRAVIEMQLFKQEPVDDLEDGRQILAEQATALLDMLTGLMDQGKYMGLLRKDSDATDLARAYLAFQNGLIQNWLRSPEEYSLKERAVFFADIMIAGLMAQR